MHKIGIINYIDVINKEYMGKLANLLQKLCTQFNNFSSKQAIENRESELIEKYKPQYTTDMETLVAIRNYAQEIADNCNRAIFELNARALYKHIDESIA